MSKCVNCENAAAVIWCPPGEEGMPFCTKHRPSFTFKPDWERYITLLPPVYEDPVDSPVSTEEVTVDSPDTQAPSEAPAEETPKETAPKKEPKK